MKLCIIGNPNNVHVRRWVAAFAAAGETVTLVGEHAPRYDLPSGIEFVDLTRSMNLRKIRYLVWSVQVRRLVDQIKPNVLHAHGLASAGWLALAAGYQPTLVTAHGSDLMLLEKRSLVHQVLTRMVLRRASYVTCVSQLLTDKAAALGVLPNRLQTAYLGVDTNIFQPARDTAQIRNDLGLGTGCYVACIRALRPLYNPDMLARAIQSILDQSAHVNFLVFTYNADSEILRQYQLRFASDIQNGRIKLVEELNNDASISKYYQAADVAISVPSSDGAPKSVQEAMACKKAVIASDIPAIREWIRPGENGLLIADGDAVALAEAILRLASDAGLRARLGEAARQEILARADLASCMKDAVLLYQNLAASSPNR